MLLLLLIFAHSLRAFMPFMFSVCVRVRLFVRFLFYAYVLIINYRLSWERFVCGT